MTNTAQRRASAPRKKQASLPQDDGTVPLIPVWVSGWGPALVIPGCLILLAALAAGVRDGAPWGWSLLLAVAVLTVAGWARGYRNRLRRNQERLDQWLCEQSEFPLVDVMGGTEFEIYCTRLAPSLGFSNIEHIGGSGDGGMDIHATDEAGDPAAMQCKRYDSPVGPDVMTAVRGAVERDRHRGRKPVLMTNARVTNGGRQAAAELGVRVIAREELGHAMWQARQKGGRPVPGTEEGAYAGTGAARPGELQRVAPGTAAALGVVSCAVVTVLVVAVRTLAVGPRPVAEVPRASVSPSAAASAAPARPEPQPGPAQVVRDYYQAISRHDWPLVWRLGGQRLGRGPYATYQGMISGYRGTVRDVLTEVRAAGDTVTGRFLAYQAGGAVRPYTFTFVVRNGVIVSGNAR